MNIRVIERQDADASVGNAGAFRPVSGQEAREGERGARGREAARVREEEVLVCPSASVLQTFKAEGALLRDVPQPLVTFRWAKVELWQQDMAWHAKRQNKGYACTDQKRAMHLCFGD